MDKRVLILGGAGMLGSMVYDRISACEGISVAATYRDIKLSELLNCEVNEYLLDAGSFLLQDQLGEILKKFQPDYIVNCIGIIKPFCRDDDPEGVINAIHVNGLFPHLLARDVFAFSEEIKILQIATDCVFDGGEGSYTEDSVHNAIDIYGKTKSLGEVVAPNMLHIRTSIIGPELKSKVSLLEWFLSHAPGADVSGYKHHIWNGATTLQFTNFCIKLILEEQYESLRALGPCLHYIQNESVSKYELLVLLNEVFNVGCNIVPTSDAGPPKNLTLKSTLLHIEPVPMLQAIRELKAHMNDSKIYKQQ